MLARLTPRGNFQRSVFRPGCKMVIMWLLWWFLFKHVYMTFSCAPPQSVCAACNVACSHIPFNLNMSVCHLLPPDLIYLSNKWHTQFPGLWILTAEGSPHLYVVFNEARRLDSSLHVETDVHLHLGLLVCQLDDWHLKAGKATSISKHYRQVISLKKKSVCVVMAVGTVTWNQQKKNSNCLKWQPFRGKNRSAISYLLSCQSAQHWSLQWFAWLCVHTPQRLLHAPSAPTVLLQL